MPKLRKRNNNVTCEKSKKDNTNQRFIYMTWNTLIGPIYVALKPAALFISGKQPSFASIRKRDKQWRNRHWLHYSFSYRLGNQGFVRCTDHHPRFFSSILPISSPRYLHFFPSSVFLFVNLLRILATSLFPGKESVLIELNHNFMSIYMFQLLIRVKL